MFAELTVEGQKKKIKLIIAAIIAAVLLPLLMLLLLAPSPTYAVHEEQGLAEHCPDHEGHPGKVNNPEASSTTTITVDGTTVKVVVSADKKSVSFTDADGNPLVVEFCIKASDLAGGKQTGSSGSVTWVNHGGQIPEISYVVVYRVVDDEEEDGSLVINKVLLNAAGAVTGGNTEANNLGFRWGFQGDSITNMMGATVSELEPGDYNVTENAIEGYTFVGYFVGEGSCVETEEDKTLPITATVEAEETTTVTLCNQADEEEQNGGGGGGQVLGDNTTGGQVLGAATQVTAPVGGVGAGGAGSIAGSLIGLGTSLSAVGYGVATLRKKQ